jgi:hypothetical protein
MKPLISIDALMLFVIFYNAIIFSSDNNMGIIDAFMLTKEVKPKINDLSFKYKNYFPYNEPILITIDGSLHAINMPTTIKPFIVTIHDAQNIIDTNPRIFCTNNNIKSIILSGSENPSNKIIHEKLSLRIIPIDHCTHIKYNKNSIDIVSLFFNTQLLDVFIGKLKFQQKILSRTTKKERVQNFLSIPRNNHFSPRQPKYLQNDEDLAIVNRASRRYSDDISSQDNPDIMHVSVPNYDFWDNASSD